MAYILVVRHLRRITSPDRLDWTVKRLLVPHGMRPMNRTDILDAATPRRTYVDGVPSSIPDAASGVTGPLPLGVLLSLVALPFLPLVLVLRYAGLLRWIVEARAHPWGRRYPPIVLTYAIRGHREASLAVDELAERLAHGEGSPVLANAEFIPQYASAHDGSNSKSIFGADQVRVYRQGRRR